MEASMSAISRYLDESDHLVARWESTTQLHNGVVAFGWYGFSRAHVSSSVNNCVYLPVLGHMHWLSTATLHGMTGQTATDQKPMPKGLMPL